MAKSKWYVYPGAGVDKSDHNRATIHVETGLRFDPGVPVELEVEVGDALVAVEKDKAGNIVSGGLLREAKGDEIKTAQHDAEQKRKHGDNWETRAEESAKKASEERGKTAAAPVKPIPPSTPPPASDEK